MFTGAMTRNLILSFFVCSTLMAYGQDEDTSSFEHNRHIYFGLNASVAKDFGKQANFFRGLNTFGISQLLDIQQIQSELYNKTGKAFSLNELPSPMKYNVGIGVGVNILYDAGDVNYILNGSFCKLNTNGVFTLAAIDPANPSGEKIIRTQEIRGAERRTWVKAGAQFKNEIDQRTDFYFELAPIVFFQKALSNTVNIEGSTYSILIQNPGYVPVKTGFMGYGLNAGMGLQSSFKSNRLMQLGINASLSKMNMVKTNKLNLMADLYLSIYL